MKIIPFLFYVIILFASCTRLPLTVYSPAPINTNTVLGKNEIAFSAAYYSNGPKHIVEDEKRSNGVNTAFKFAPINHFFIEGGLASLKENVILAGRDIFTNDSIRASRDYKHNYKEIGIGGFYNPNKYVNLYGSVGIGQNKFTSAYQQSNNLVFRFNNIFNCLSNQYYINVGAQFTLSNFNIGLGLKNNFISYKNINTNSSSFYVSEIESLASTTKSPKNHTQMYFTFGVANIKEIPWFSFKTYSSFNGVSSLAYVSSRQFTFSTAVYCNFNVIGKHKK